MSPKVLVISNNALSMTNSNGRTLGLLLSSIEKENLMQFCIKEESISKELITNSYCISDTMIIKGLFKKEIISRSLPFTFDKAITKNEIKTINKTTWKFLVRELIWEIKLKKLDFLKKALEFKPDVIIFQLGNSAFLANLTYEILKKCNSKLIVFTTEDYYFKKWNYIEPNKKSFIFQLLMKKYRKSIDKIFNKTSLCIANTPELAKKYQRKFNIATEVIMAAASNSISSYFKKENNTIVYAGNLMLNRYKSVISIAKIVSKISPETKIEVYGKTTPEIEKELIKERNILIKGFVEYSKLLYHLANARLLIHCESFDEFYRRDLESAFSTKIADSLSSGVPLLLYAPANFSETIYVTQEKCAVVCSDIIELENSIRIALKDESLRRLVVNNAKNLAKQNHNLKKNQEKMYKNIVRVCTF